MSTNDNFTPAPAPGGFLTTGDMLVDELMMFLNQSGRNQIEAFSALLRACIIHSLIESEGETQGMLSARELIRNGALMFDRELKFAQAAAVDEEVA